MPRETRGIDHMTMLARDLDAATAAYERLGFQVTPRTYHPFGTANNLVMFRKDFLELLGVADPGQPNDRVARVLAALEQREGAHSLGLLSTDAHADRDEFAAAGLSPGEVFHFRRPVLLPGGRQSAVEVDVVDVMPPDPPLRYFVSHQQVPEAIWVPQWQQQPNGVEEILAVTAVAPDPSALDALHRGLMDAGAVAVARDGSRHVTTTHGRIDVLTPPAFRERYGTDPVAAGPSWGGVELRAASLDHLRGMLRRNGVAFSAVGEAIVAGPTEAGGTLLRFTGGR